MLPEFGERGIPSVYSPLGIYLYAIFGRLLGETRRAGLLLPGLFLPLQGLAGYAFVKAWIQSEHAAQWTAASNESPGCPSLHDNSLDRGNSESTRGDSQEELFQPV